MTSAAVDALISIQKLQISQFKPNSTTVCIRSDEV